MALDPLTMLTLSVALALAAALYQAVEWRTVREPSLLFWSAGFALISIGSTLALLRVSGLLLIGIWFANGLLVTAHWLFLLGVARFRGVRLSRGWYLIFVAWAALLLLPGEQIWSKVILLLNSFLVALPTLKASLLLRSRDKSLGAGAAQLRYVLLGHSLFYFAKMIPPVVPGTLIDLSVFGGTIIQISLVEGVMAIMLIALSMTGTVRYRRERQIERLAARDPLTAMYNRRALEARAPRLLSEASPARPGALLLIDAGCVWDARTALRRGVLFAEFIRGWLDEPLRGWALDGYGWRGERAPLPGRNARERLCFHPTALLHRL